MEKQKLVKLVFRKQTLRRLTPLRELSAADLRRVVAGETDYSGSPACGVSRAALFACGPPREETDINAR